MIQQDLREFRDNRMWKIREVVVIRRCDKIVTTKEIRVRSVGENQVTTSGRSVAGTKERDYDVYLLVCIYCQWVYTSCVGNGIYA